MSEREIGDNLGCTIVVVVICITIVLLMAIHLWLR